MDELIAVRSFRADVEPDAAARARVQARLDELLAAPRRSRRRRRRRAALVIAVALLAGVAAASSAFGWTERLIDLVAGEPAPPSVKQAFALQNEMFGKNAFPVFRRGAASEAIVAKAHGVLGVETSAGPVYIWAAPTRGGGLCWTLDIVRNRLPSGRPNGGGACSPNLARPRSALQAGMRVTQVSDGRYLRLIQGWARADVDAVELEYPDGTRDELPIFEGFVLQEPRRDETPSFVVAVDRFGHELARQAIRDPRTHAAPRMPELTGPERVLFDYVTVAGFELTFSIAPAAHGQLIQTELYRGGVSNGWGPDPRERIAPDEIAVHPGLRNEAGSGALLVFSGLVGSRVASLRLIYTDGTVTGIPIAEQFVHFEIPPTHHQDRRFTVVAYDRNGDELGRRVIK